MKSGKRILPVLVLLSVGPGRAPDAGAAPINVLLATNGGVLEEGPEAIRDGDCMTPAQNIGGQSGSIRATITFPSTYIEHVNYRLGGACYQYDGGATCSLNVYLRIGGSWTLIWSWYGSGWQNYDTGCTTNDNAGFGWDDASGMRLESSVWGSDTGSASATHYEMQAWTPEPATLSLLALGGLAVLRRRR